MKRRKPTKREIRKAIDILDRAACEKNSGPMKILSIAKVLGATRFEEDIAFNAFMAAPFGDERAADMAFAAAMLRDGWTP